MMQDAKLNRPARGSTGRPAAWWWMNGACVLLIERWVTRGGAPFYEARLPKGHVEAGETDAEAALREVCEEAGAVPVVGAGRPG